MDERILILDRRIRKDLEALDGIWQQLEAADLGGRQDDGREVVFVAYQLHNLYNAVENIFRNIAGAFGNHLDNKRGWHAELLDRMRLDLSPLRPAVIDDDSFRRLDELRRFRHVFRGAYSFELDAKRLHAVRDEALALHESLPRQIGEFLEFLETLES